MIIGEASLYNQLAARFCAKLFSIEFKVKWRKFLRDEQHGFRQNRSCCDLIFSLRILLEESNEWQVQLLTVFSDFLKAFDLIHRDHVENFNTLRDPD